MLTDELRNIVTVWNSFQLFTHAHCSFKKLCLCPRTYFCLLAFHAVKSVASNDWEFLILVKKRKDSVKGLQLHIFIPRMALEQNIMFSCMFPGVVLYCRLLLMFLYSFLYSSWSVYWQYWCKFWLLIRNPDWASSVECYDTILKWKFMTTSSHILPRSLFTNTSPRLMWCHITFADKTDKER
jgi:hypothetical protein